MATTNHRQTCRDSRSRLSPVCTRCRDKHLKCNGGSPCARCAPEGLSCVYTFTRRGQRRTKQLPTPRTNESVSSGTCITCRQRHLRCSGGPLCARCAKEGIPCIFQSSRRGQRKRIQTLFTQKSPPSVPSAVQPSVSLHAEKIDDERAFRGFCYFCETTSHALSGYQDQYFWSALTLQASHDQPAIKHILVALGSLNDSIEAAYSTGCGERAQDLYKTSLQHYDQAIRLLRDTKAGDLSIEVILISYILFICFETMQSDYPSAMNLLYSGSKFLTGCQALDSDFDNKVDHATIQVFSRVNFKVSTFIRAAAITLRPHPTGLFLKRRTFVPDLDVPPFFSSISQARNCFETMFETGYGVYDHPICDPDLCITPDLVSRYSSFIDTWYGRLNTFLDQNPDSGGTFQQEALRLKCQYHMARILAPKMLDQGELHFDSHHNEFRALLALCSDSLLLNRNDKDDPLTPYEVKLGIIHGSFLCAIYCRCPKLRREAVDLLLSKKCRKFCQYSCIAAKIAQRVIGIEEKGLVNPQRSNDVPGLNRIRLLGADRVCEETSSGVCSALDRNLFNLWLVDRAPPSSVEGLWHLRLSYVRSPWDFTSPVEEAYLDVAVKDELVGGKDMWTPSATAGDVM